MIESKAKVSLLPEVVDTHGGKPCRVVEILGNTELNYNFRFND
jgi:hypothetical protein